MTTLVAAALTPTVVGGTAVAALLLVVFVHEAAGPLVAVAHEGGHMAVGLLTGLRVNRFEIKSRSNAETTFGPLPWGPGRILMTIAGYVAPPLLGLRGAALLAAGKAWPLLWTMVVLLVLAFVKAEKEWTTFWVLLFAAATGYVALYGAPRLQAAYAAGLVWLLLFGGLRSAVEAGKHRDTDPDYLFRDTLIPRTLWKAGFIVVALYCLWKGFLLLKP
jgi:Peptidase M50B-like